MNELEPFDGAAWTRLLERVDSARADVIDIAAKDTGADATILEPAFDHIIRLVSTVEVTEEQIEEATALGVRLARAGEDGRLVMDAYLSLSWAIWQGATTGVGADMTVVVELAERLMKSSDRAIAAIAEGYVQIEVELASAHSERRRSVLEELLTAPRSSPEARTRIRRRAARHGLDTDGDYRIILVHFGGEDDEAPDAAIDRLEPYVQPPSTHHRHRPGIALPVVIEWRGSILILASGRWTGEHRLRDGLPQVIGTEWTVVDSGLISGVEALAPALDGVEYSSLVAASLGRSGWIADSSELALETMYLLDAELARTAIDRELGALLTDERMGDEYVETLEVYLSSGQNSRETARRLHLSPRTVTYRLERIESLLGEPLDSEVSLRLGAVLLARRVSRQTARHE